ncbi:uncharacterized protein N7469_000148, partial [Penicillium citrinum]
RLTDIESKLTNIIGLLSNSSASTGGVQAPADVDAGLPAISGSLSNSPYPTADWMSQGYLGYPQFDEGLNTTSNYNGTGDKLKSPQDLSTTSETAWITDLGLSPVVIAHLLDRFRSMASYFPFVRFSNHWNVASMAEDRPFLLLAAVAVAASCHCHLQDVLIRQFKKSLSQRVLIAGEQDLDLLQGLLVHIAWFHFDFVPRSQQTYRYLQIAISLAVDLRLDQKISVLLDQQSELGDAYNLESCRAYLGCYYMSSVIAISSGKPNNLRFHKNMLLCAMILESQPEFETDLLICPVIKAIQFAEEICDTYRSEGTYGPQLHIHAERFTMRFEEWCSSLSTETRNATLLVNAYYAVKIRIQEMGLVYCYGLIRPQRRNEHEDSTISSVSPMVINNLIKCVSFTKEYLDYFIALPSADLNSLPFSAWYQVIFTLFVLYRLSVGLPEVPEWNVEIAQHTVDLIHYLDLLSSQMKAIQPSADRQLPTKSLFSRLPEIIGNVKTSYTSVKESHMHDHDSRNAHPEFLASIEKASSSQRQYRCPALRYSSRNTFQPPSQPILQSAIATEVQRIEYEQLWGDLMLMGTFPSIANSSSSGF